MSSERTQISPWGEKEVPGSQHRREFPGQEFPSVMRGQPFPRSLLQRRLLSAHNLQKARGMGITSSILHGQFQAVTLTLLQSLTLFQELCHVTLYPVPITRHLPLTLPSVRISAPGSSEFSLKSCLHENQLQYPSKSILHFSPCVSFASLADVTSQILPEHTSSPPLTLLLYHH